VKGRKYYNSEVVNYIKNTVFSRFVATNFMMDERAQKKLDELAKKDFTVIRKAYRLADEWVGENVKDVAAQDVIDFREKRGKFWVEAHRKYPNADKNSFDARTRLAISSRLAQFEGGGFTIEERRAKNLSPRGTAEWYLDSLNKKWPLTFTPLEKRDPKMEAIRAAEVDVWTKYLEGKDILDLDVKQELIKMILKRPDLFDRRLKLPSYYGPDAGK